MENDTRSINNENLIDINDYFKLDFVEQTLKGNRKFEEFKRQKLNELGKNAKLFHCKNDNVYFYVSKEECEIDPRYYKQCPSCKNYTCYFCGRITNYPLNEYYKGGCCAKLRLYYIFFYDGFQYLNKDFKEVCFIEIFGIHNCFILLPFLNFFYLVFNITCSLYFLLRMKDKNLQNNYYGLYYKHYSDNNYKKIILIFVLTYLLFSICFFLLYSTFIIILLIISLFTKLYPLKYFFGIINGAYYMAT